MFGKKKKGDFFLEIDETKEKATSAPATEETKVEAPAKTEAVVEEAKPQAAPQKASKTSIKDQKKAAPAPVAPPKPAPVAAKVVTPTEVNFATKYILPVFTSGPRRRPGPSLNSFLSMASEVKVPSSAK